MSRTISSTFADTRQHAWVEIHRSVNPNYGSRVSPDTHTQVILKCSAGGALKAVNTLASERYTPNGAFRESPISPMCNGGRP